MMDKDSIILHYIKNEIADCDKDISDLSSMNSDSIERLNKADNNIAEIYKLLGKTREPHMEASKKETDRDTETLVETPKSYDKIFKIALESLITRGVDVDNLDYHSLISDVAIKQITDNLNRPLEKKLKWSKNDFIVVFVAASIGSLVDIILGDRDNNLTGKGSQFSEWLNQLHQHAGGAPIDYQGPGFGGGFHRGLSKGHDIMKFIEAIMMFKNGSFVGTRYVNGVLHKVVSTVNQNGTPYEQLGLIEAIVKYIQHMFADLFSTCSLPFPGSSFLVECNNRDIRKFVATMYHQGFNLKNIMIQSLSTIMVEIIIRVYFGIDEVKRYKDDIEIEEDYSNFKAIERFIRPVGKEKLYEMLLLAHIIVIAVNVGKVILKKHPWEINITEIISVIRYAIPVLNRAINRNSEYAKLIRNADEININWGKLLSEYSIDNLALEFPEEILII